MRRVARFLADQPSDTSSDPYFDDDTVEETILTVESETFIPSENEILVSSILELVPAGVGSAATEERRAEINEALLRLEALNPTPQPAMDPRLNGVWQLVYAGNYASEGAILSPTRQIALFLYSGGYSPALFALELAEKLPKFLFDFNVDGSGLEISISRNQPRVEGKVSVRLLGGESQTVSVKCRLEPVSSLRLRECYESATVLGKEVELPSLLQYSREIYVTYVDDDILVIRDGSGIPELLLRKEKSFTRNWGTDP